MEVNKTFRVLPLLLILAWPGGAFAQQLDFLALPDDLPDLQAQQPKLDKSKPAPETIRPEVQPQPGPSLFPDGLQQPTANSMQGEGLGESTAGFNPHLMGDFGTFYSRIVITVTSLQTVTTTTTINGPPPINGPPQISNSPAQPPGRTITTTTTIPVTTTRVVFIPVSGMGAFNVGENESPRPQDRVFVFYNFFDDIRGPDIGSNVPIIHNTSSTTVSNGVTTTIQASTVTPGVLPRVSLDREVFGFEKTFFDGNASVEFRLPLLQQQGGGFNDYAVGDLTMLAKYAFLNDRSTGNLVSAGLALTVPTGPGIETISGSIDSTLLQPFAGYIWNFASFYVQGIHSIVVPTDARVPTLMFNDIGVNVWAYRASSDRFLSFVVPTFETHVTTSLNHRSENDALFVPDVVVLTSGAHFGIYKNGVLTLGAAAPVTGPTPFSVEAFMQFNWRF